MRGWITCTRALPLFRRNPSASTRSLTCPCGDGWVPVSLLVDRQSGRCIATSARDRGSHACKPGTGNADPRSVREEMFGEARRPSKWEIATCMRPPLGRGRDVRATWVSAGGPSRSRHRSTTSLRPAPKSRASTDSAPMLVDRTSRRANPRRQHDAMRDRDQSNALKAIAA